MANDRLRQAMSDAGLTANEVAVRLGVDEQTVQRWVRGRIPYPRHRYRLVGLLGVPEAVLWPALEEAQDPPGRDLTGDWWACWQTWREGEEVVTVQPVRLEQVGDTIHVENVEPGVPVGGGEWPAGTSQEAADYHWMGELRVWAETALMGWYASRTRGIRSHGVLYLRLHPHGVEAVGRWVGESYDGAVITGWGVLAHTQEAAEAAIRRVAEHGVNDTV